MINIFYRIINFVKKEQPKLVLGRWNIDYNTKKINKKIDLSNEDHCGPCGQYIVKKKYEDILYNNNKKYEDILYNNKNINK